MVQKEGPVNSKRPVREFRAIMGVLGKSTNNPDDPIFAP